MDEHKNMKVISETKLMCKKYVHIHIPLVVFLNFLALLQSRISREKTSNMLMNIILNNYTGDKLQNSKEK